MVILISDKANLRTKILLENFTRKLGKAFPNYKDKFS